MSRPFTLDSEPPAAIPRTQEIALLSRAVAANPTATTLRARLAVRLFEQDQFTAAIPLFQGVLADAPALGPALYLADCHLALATAADDRQAERVARRALEMAANSYERGRAFAVLGKALNRQDRPDEARAALRAALTEDPHAIDAYRRLVTLEQRDGAHEDMLTIADRMLRDGVGHPQLLATRGATLARLGRIAEAREAIGLDRFLYRTMLTPPPGWADIAALNAAVKAELAERTGWRMNRYGSAGTDSWNIYEPSQPHLVATAALQERIRQAIVDHVPTLDAQDTPWTNARPATAQLRNSYVRAEAAGFEKWHIHPGGWLSGVYYVDVPTAVADGPGHGGCLAFGLPDDVAGADGAAAFGETIVRPRPGLLLLFPSHCHHRTFAHGTDEDRICVAFDVRPR